MSKTIGDAIHQLHSCSYHPKERGRKFEVLVKETLPSLPEYEISTVYDFPEWVDRVAEFGQHSGRDLGIDLVAQRRSGGWIAIQCKFRDADQAIHLNDVSTFIASVAPTDNFKFHLSLLITTCPIGKHTEELLQAKNIKWLPYHIRHRNDPIRRTMRQQRTSHPQQVKAIQSCIKGLSNHDRGRLIMACGTGKTYTALRIAEADVLQAQRVLFTAPSIALVGQARREWLRHAHDNNLENLIVCSDSSSGKTSQDDSSALDILELECPVTTNPAQIAKFLRRPHNGNRHAVFCTYQSLDKVAEAQQQHAAPPYDLAIIDEAHRTVGIQHGSKQEKLNGDERGKIGFTAIHDDAFINVRKRLYMTATPKVYADSSRTVRRKQGLPLVDMDDQKVFGPEFYRLKFKQAVNPVSADEESLLSDYRVIVLGIRRRPVSKQLTERLRQEDDGSVEKRGLAAAILKVQGATLALNGEVEHRYKGEELPSKLHASIGFCNRITVSRWYAMALADPKIRELTTRKLPGDRQAMSVHAQHLDGKCTALERLKALEDLITSRSDDECRVLMNAKLFSEGVDVPTLDAVIFMEPRKSQIDVVQAVGRAMRKASDKKFGYIILPVVVPEGGGPEALLNDKEGYHEIGKVLAALQSHDERLDECPHQLIRYVELDLRPPPRKESEEDSRDDGDESTSAAGVQMSLFDPEQTKGLFVRLMDNIGLGDRGRRNADEIVISVETAAKLLDQAGAAETLGPLLDIPFQPNEEKNHKHICTTAALLIQNACLLHKRLCELPQMKALHGIEGLGAESNPAEVLLHDWQIILGKDYRPIFGIARRVLQSLRDTKLLEREAARQGIMQVVQCANELGSELGDFGWDHAGPLYHKILGTAESEGAFYTKNVAALLLARLAINKKFLPWSDPKVLHDFKLIDPACGSGTLLMAAVKVLKDRIREATKSKHDAPIHKQLIEESVYGLDINEHAIQLAASNLTLGAPNVDYKRMNLYRMKHGPDKNNKNNQAFAGSLELLAGNRPWLETQKDSTIEQVGGKHFDKVHRGSSSDVMGRCDLVIMNPPYTNNVKRSSYYGKEYKEAMAQRERYLQQEVTVRQGESASALIDATSIATFFTPLAAKLLKNCGTWAKVRAATACTSSSGLKERRWIAERFHVEQLITCHAKKDFSFSGNTDIHECLMIFRQLPPPPPPPPR